MKALITVIVLGSAAASYGFGFDDITTWAGTGSNRAALVIDWNDGKNPESLVWGYRWNGAANGQAMWDAISALDTRLVRVQGGGGPQTMFGLGYDLDNDGFSLTGTGETAVATDSDDHYGVGWFTAGFWGSYEVDGTTEAPTTWNFGSGSFFQTSIADGSWRGFAFAPGFNGDAPGVPANPPVPEPVTVLALAAGLAGLARRRARRAG